MGVLAPGTTKRRWEPEGGVRKHNERIHRESAVADNKNLPFTFSKPSKPKRHVTVKCEKCSNVATVPVNTVGMICVECKQYVNIEGV